VKLLTKTISIHDQIIQHLLNKYRNHGVDMRPRDIFYNYRKKGLRLTYLGYDLLKQEFDCYRYPLESDTIIKPKHLIALDRNMQWPYYLSKKQIVLFSEEDSVVFKLVGGYENWISSIKL